MELNTISFLLVQCVTGKNLFPNSLCLVFPSGTCNCLEEGARRVWVFVSLHPLQFWSLFKHHRMPVRWNLSWPCCWTHLSCLSTCVSLTAWSTFQGSCTPLMVATLHPQVATITPQYAVPFTLNCAAGRPALVEQTAAVLVIASLDCVH